MNSIFRTVIVVGLISGFGTLIGILIPNPITSEINNDIIYFLLAMRPMNLIFPMETIYQALKVFINFLFGVSIFYVGRWILHLIAG